jgi:WD40 repeat protein
MNISSTGIALTLPDAAGSILNLAWSPDGSYLAAVTSRGYVSVWKAASGELMLQKQITRARLLSVAWSQQGRALLLGSDQGLLSTLHLATRTVTTTSTFFQPITHIAWSLNTVMPRFFVVTGQELKVFAQGKLKPFTLRYHTPIQDACWSPDGNQIALLCRNSMAEVWDAQTRRVIWCQTYHCRPVSITWDATGKRLALGCQDGSVQLQELTSATSTESVTLSRFPIQDVRWNERYLAASSEEHVALWDGSTTLLPRPRATPSQPLAFDPDGTRLATVFAQSITVAAAAALL